MAKITDQMKEELEVYEDGTIKRDGEICPWIFNTAGYPQVCSGKKKYLVHVLVATAFLEKPSDEHEVHHKDEDKGNPNLTNLVWLTHQENSEASLAKSFDFIDPQRKPYNDIQHEKIL